VFATDSGLCFWDLVSGQEVAYVPGGFERVVQVERSGAVWTCGALWKQGAGLLRWPVAEVGSPGHLRIGPPERVSPSHSQDVSVSTDGQEIAIAPNDGGVEVIRRGGTEQRFRVGPEYDARKAGVSPDGRWIISGSHFYDNRGFRFRVWDAATGRLVAYLPFPDVEDVQGFSPDSRWLYVLKQGGEGRRIEVASLTASPLPPTAPAAAPEAPSWRPGWRSETTREGGTFSRDGRYAAFGQNDGQIQLVLAETDRQVALLPSPEQGKIRPQEFSPDGSLLLARGDETGTLYAFDLRLIRAGLDEHDLDWDAPPFPPAGPEPKGPLRVEIIGGEAAASAEAMDRAERQRADHDLALDPANADAHYRLGVILLREGKPEGAAAELSRALELALDLSAALYPRAVAAARLARWADVAADTSRHLERYPSDYLALNLRAQARMRLGRHSEAADDWTALLRLSPPDRYAASCHEARATCHDATGRADLARADRERAVKLASDDPDRLNSGAWHLLSGSPGERDPARALALIRKALEKRPDDPMFMNTYGVALYRNGLYADAVTTLQKSLELGHGQWDAFDLFFLAMARHRLGDASQARADFDRAVRWVNGQTNLSAEHAAELKAFRAEAEAVLADVPGELPADVFARERP
jgi:tetratricopeptide (TPR) repeat protein